MIQKTALLLTLALLLISCNKSETATINGKVKSSTGLPLQGAKVYIIQLPYDTIKLYQEVVDGQVLYMEMQTQLRKFESFDKMVAIHDKYKALLKNPIDEPEIITEYKELRDKTLEEYEYNFLKDDIRRYVENSLAFEQLKESTIKEYERIKTDKNTISTISDNKGEFSVPVKQGCGIYRIMVERNSAKPETVLDGRNMIFLGAVGVSKSKNAGTIEAIFQSLY